MPDVRFSCQCENCGCLIPSKDPECSGFFYCNIGQFLPERERREIAAQRERLEKSVSWKWFDDLKLFASQWVLSPIEIRARFAERNRGGVCAFFDAIDPAATLADTQATSRTAKRPGLLLPFVAVVDRFENFNATRVSDVLHISNDQRFLDRYRKQPGYLERAESLPDIPPDVGESYELLAGVTFNRMWVPLPELRHADQTLAGRWREDSRGDAAMQEANDASGYIAITVVPATSRDGMR